MDLLQQPVLFASEPTQGLLGLGVTLTIVAGAIFAVVLVACLRRTTSERKQGGNRVQFSVGQSDTPTANSARLAMSRQ
jgi:hypothetical protein